MPHELAVKATKDNLVYAHMSIAFNFWFFLKDNSFYPWLLSACPLKDRAAQNRKRDVLYTIYLHTPSIIWPGLTFLTKCKSVDIRTAGRKWELAKFLCSFEYPGVEARAYYSKLHPSSSSSISSAIWYFDVCLKRTLSAKYCCHLTKHRCLY